MFYGNYDLKSTDQIILKPHSSIIHAEMSYLNAMSVESNSASAQR